MAAKDGAWYVVTAVFSFSGTGLQAYPSRLRTGSDPVQIIRRSQLALERSLLKRTGMSYVNNRPGDLYAVWRFDHKAPLAQAKETVLTKPPWRVFVITDKNSWRNMAELCLPPGVDLFADERHTEDGE